MATGMKRRWRKAPRVRRTAPARRVPARRRTAGAGLEVPVLATALGQGRHGPDLADVRARRERAAHSRSPPPANTACCSSALRQRQEHARAAPAGTAAGSRRGRGDRVSGNPLAVAARLSARRLAATALSRAASHGVCRRSRRGRRAPASRRDFAGAQWRALPRRAAGIRSRRARGLARTAGERHIVLSRAARQASTRRGSSWWPR